VSATIDTAAIASAFAAPAFTSASEARLEKATAAGTAPSAVGVINDASVSPGALVGTPQHQAALWWTEPCGLGFDRFSIHKPE
jgi:hypothetical protein